jgi:uncharacterized membrane protein YraQ (UPF0718 family)
MPNKHLKNKALIIGEMLFYGVLLAGLIWYFLPQALQ